MFRLDVIAKIRLILAIALVGGTTASAFLVARLRSVDASYREVLSGAARRDRAREMQLALKGEVQAWKNILIRGSDPAALETYSSEFRAMQARVNEIASALGREEPDPEIRELCGQFGRAHRELGGKYAEGLETFVQAKGVDPKAADQIVKGQDRAPTDLIDRMAQTMATRAADAESAQAKAVSRMIWAVSLGLFAFFAAIITGSGLVLRGLSAGLRQSMREFARSAEQVSSAALQMASTSQSLAQGSSEQAASLEETSASAEEINAMARKNAENSQKAGEVVASSGQAVAAARLSLQQMVAAMAGIHEQSTSIAKIIKVIDEIAFQTNILALNAAVEAARAGDAGLGFAVVAGEVRNLAQRSAEAARETAALIEGSMAKANDGKAKVDLVAGAIHVIDGEGAKLKLLVDEVNTGSQEQTRGIEQVARAITQMEQVTQRVAASAEEGASAAEELTVQSEALMQAVDRVRALVG